MRDLMDFIIEFFACVLRGAGTVWRASRPILKVIPLLILIAGITAIITAAAAIGIFMALFS